MSRNHTPAELDRKMRQLDSVRDLEGGVVRPDGLGKLKINLGDSSGLEPVDAALRIKAGPGLRRTRQGVIRADELPGEQITATANPRAGDHVECDTTAGAVTINLPRLDIQTPGAQLTVTINAGANTAILTPMSGDTIMGNPTYALTPATQTVTLVANPDRDDWIIR